MPLIVVIKTYVFGSALEPDIFVLEDIDNWINWYIKRAQSDRAHNNI